MVNLLKISPQFQEAFAGHICKSNKQFMSMKISGRAKKIRILQDGIESEPWIKMFSKLVGAIDHCK